MHIAWCCVRLSDWLLKLYMIVHWTKASTVGVPCPSDLRTVKSFFSLFVMHQSQFPHAVHDNYVMVSRENMYPRWIICQPELSVVTVVVPKLNRGGVFCTLSCCHCYFFICSCGWQDIIFFMRRSLSVHLSACCQFSFLCDDYLWHWLIW